jgi:DNA-directed RNA polymerase specialized sigma24 family protein
MPEFIRRARCEQNWSPTFESPCKVTNPATKGKQTAGMSRQHTITQAGFDRFLSCLSENRETAGLEYERIRGRLILYFQCRDIIQSEDCADEAINRVILKLEAGQEIRDPATYVFGIARMILQESARTRRRHQAIEDDRAVSPAFSDEDDELQRRMDCLRDCLRNLPADDRDLITQYYQEQKRAKIDLRQRLARRFGIDMNALRVRACRLRSSLQKCVRNCVQKSKPRR